MNIGSDRIYRQDDRVFIQAVEPMDWPVREFCRVAIFFEGRRYYLCSKWAAERPYAMVYELRPWPSDLHEASTVSVVYDEAYVLERDQAAMTGRRQDHVYLALVLFYPFLGLLWSGFKERVLTRVGFEPSSITKASIALTFNLFIAEGVFVGWLGAGLLMGLLGQPALQPIDWGLMLLLGSDSVLRFSQSLKVDVDHWWGFGEWLWPRRR